MSKISVTLCGGLGNQLFQLATGQSISKKTNRTLCLPEFPTSHHSKQAYNSTIFSKWTSSQKNITDPISLEERSYRFQEWNLPYNQNVLLCGYFQNYQYVLDEFGDSLVLPEVPTLQGAFIHIRGGDYVNHWLHDVKLESYYEKAIRYFPQHTKFYIFTNDVSYAKTFSFLTKIDYEFIDEADEVRSLALLKNCSLGGICPNSTFSWWGAYLNRENRTLILPSKWFNDLRIYVGGYLFPGSIVIDV